MMKMKKPKNTKMTNVYLPLSYVSAFEFMNLNFEIVSKNDFSQV